MNEAKEFSIFPEMGKKFSQRTTLPFLGKKIELVNCPKYLYGGEMRCGGCQRPKNELLFISAMKTCVRCKIAQYCSKECQAKDYSFHKSDCKATQLPTEIKRETLSTKLSGIMAMIKISDLYRSFDGFKMAQIELTKYLHFCVKYRDISQVENALTLKCFLYLHNDSYLGSEAMVGLILKFLNLHSAHEQMKWLKNDILEKCLKYDKGLFEEIVTDCKNNGPIYFLDAYCPNGKAPDALIYGPFHVLIAVLCYQIRSSYVKGFRLIEEHPELTQVLKLMSARDSKALERLVNPTEENFDPSKNCEWTEFLTELAFPFFCSIPGARSYVFNYMYPGAEIVAASVDL